MKKLFLLLMLVLIFGINNIKSQCTITPFYVHPDSAYKGAMKPQIFRFCEGEIVEDRFVQILPMTVYEYKDTMWDVINFKLDSLSPPLPTWIDYICLNPGNMFYAGIWTCVSLNSNLTVNVSFPAGKDSLVYKYALYVTAIVKAQGTSTEITQSATPSDSITIIVYKRKNGSCDWVYNPHEGINNIKSKPLIVYPNPSNGKINIQYPKTLNPISINIYDSQGQEVYKQYSAKNISEIELNTKGLYFVRVSDNENVWVSKVVIN